MAGGKQLYVKYRPRLDWSAEQNILRTKIY